MSSFLGKTCDLSRLSISTVTHLGLVARRGGSWQTSQETMCAFLPMLSETVASLRSLCLSPRVLGGKDSAKEQRREVPRSVHHENMGNGVWIVRFIYPQSHTISTVNLSHDCSAPNLPTDGTMLIAQHNRHMAFVWNNSNLVTMCSEQKTTTLLDLLVAAATRFFG